MTTTAPSLMRTGSYFNARIRGQPDKEFAWFSLGSTLPLITMDPERATRQIVQATRRGAAEQTLSVPETILAKFNGLFPGLTSDIMSRVDQYILQDADGSVDVEKEGKQFHSEFESKAQEAATLLGQRSAQRFQPERNFPQEGISDPRD